MTKLSVRVKALDHFNEDEDEDNKKNKVKLGLEIFNPSVVRRKSFSLVIFSIDNSTVSV